MGKVDLALGNKAVLSRAMPFVAHCIDATRGLTWPQASTVIGVIAGAAVVIVGGMATASNAVRAGADVEFTCGPLHMGIKSHDEAA